MRLRLLSLSTIHSLPTLALPTLALPILVLFLALVGCADTTNPKEPLTIPAQIDSVEWAANASSEIAYINDMVALLTETKKARTPGVPLVGAEINLKLQPLYRLLSAEHGAMIAAIVDKTVRASGKTMDPMKAPSENGDGGAFVKYLFDEYGTDLNEQIEKTLFSMALYTTAVTMLDTATPTARNVDRALALFGATPAFKNSAADRFCAGYAARRDKNDGNGFYTTIRDAFKKARAAANAGSAYTTEYNEAVATIKSTWERSQMATAINYCYATMTTLGATTVDDNARATGMHSFSEAIGFLWGWSTTPNTQRIISDAQLAEALTLMRAPVAGPWTFYEMWQMPASRLADIGTTATKIQAAYGFTDAEMLDFKTNWVSVQGRQ